VAKFEMSNHKASSQLHSFEEQCALATPERNVDVDLTMLSCCETSCLHSSRAVFVKGFHGFILATHQPSSIRSVLGSRFLPQMEGTVTCCTNDVGMMGIHFKLSQTAHGDLSRLETYTPQLPPGHRQPTMSKSLAEYKQPPDATGIHCRKIGYPKNLRINLTLLSSALLDGNCETGMAITISCAVVDSISGATNAENNINQWFNHPTYQLLSSTLKPSETKYIIYV